VTLGLSQLVGHDLYWPMTIGWGLWAAADARTHDMKRYERVFPLDPLALFLAVVVLFPVALPWYLRLKNRAVLGLLAEPTRPSRARWVIVGGAVAASLGATLFWFSFTRSGTYQTLMGVVTAVQAATPERVNVTIHTGVEMTITVLNTAVAAPDRHEAAHRLAVTAIGKLPRSSRVTRVRVQFQEVTARAGVTFSQTQQSFTWTVADLRAKQPAVSVRRVA
jgi:hypothetical protein